MTDEDLDNLSPEQIQDLCIKVRSKIKYGKMSEKTLIEFIEWLRMISDD